MTILLCSLSGFIAVAGIVTAATKNFRMNVLTLWLSGMGLGVMYLVLGSEILAIAQWFLATTITLVILTYALVMGDWLTPDTNHLPWREWILPICGAVSFTGIIAIGLHDFEQWTLDISFEPVSVSHFGAQLVSHHPLVLLILGFEILLTLIGVGVVGRGDWVTSKAGEA